MSKRTAREIARDCTEIPAGWPRPYYRNADGGVSYAQWSSATAYAQITHCHANRTFAAAANHLCSSCGSQMERGLLFDREQLKAMHAPGTTVVSNARSYFDDVLVIDELDVIDTHYGSPICFRCAVFARNHCPYLSALHTHVGDDFPWVVTTSASQYREYDRTTALELLDPATHERMTTGEVKVEVTAGHLYLTGLTPDDFAHVTRPTAPESAEGYRAESAWDPTEPNSIRSVA